MRIQQPRGRSRHERGFVDRVNRPGLLGALIAALGLIDDPAPAHASDFQIVGQAAYCEATIIEGPNPRGASSAAPQGKAVILYDKRVMVDLPYLRPFVMAHECAHHALGHTTPQGLLTEGHAFQQKELDADCWAAYALGGAETRDVAEQQIALFRAQKTLRPGPRYPTWASRAKRMQNCLDGTTTRPRADE